ncbi:hypothetical protein A1O1_05147 [Capronia coronata CBS 617.96]|uniref:Rhodopsin domain-containing protein n=1 Tax=Capronia coronata CBS 617.96 TaxID=1182541 RepID=W9Y5V9_9EURO|nr:uncharacterized protein A1O1_05147 [Capronia coronata CBS 617.96]EXJ88217.1 hypothetical protein A1O1_05147 [Capronia coronata CBS 617.96]
MAAFSSASATAIALAALSGCCVLGRLLTRIAFVHHVGPEDCLIVLAWAAAVALAAVTQQQNHTVSTTGQSDEEQVRLISLLRQLWSTNITYNLAVLLLKDSLLFQYLRFSIDVGYRRACWALGSIITGYGLSALLVGIFSCQPVAYSWNSNIHGGKCVDFLAFWLFNASFNSATDIIVCVLPIPVLKALQLPRHQLGILAGVFLLGAFVCVASIIRIFAVYRATAHNHTDPAIAIWSAVEVNIGIICACLPSLRHPITQYWPRIQARHYRRTPHESLPDTDASINLTRLKYSGPVVKCLERNLSRSSSLQSKGESTSSSQPTLSGDMDATATATAFALDDSTPYSATAGPSGPASNDNSYSQHSEAADPWKSSWPMISTVTEINVSEDDGESGQEDGTTEHINPLPLPAVPLPGARPLGPRPPALQKQPNSSGPPPAVAPPPPVVLRSHKLSKSKGLGSSRPVFPMACIPESSGTSTPDIVGEGEEVDGDQHHDGGHEDNPNDRDQADHDRHQHGEDDHDHIHDHEYQHDTNNQSHYPSRRYSHRLTDEPTIVIPPQHSISQSYPYTHPQSPGSPSSTYTSTSITTVSSHNTNSVTPWATTDWAKGSATRASKTYSYEILGGPRALEASSLWASSQPSAAGSIATIASHSTSAKSPSFSTSTPTAIPVAAAMTTTTPISTPIKSTPTPTSPLAKVMSRTKSRTKSKSSPTSETTASAAVTLDYTHDKDIDTGNKNDIENEYRNVNVMPYANHGYAPASPVRPGSNQPQTQTQNQTQTQTQTPSPYSRFGPRPTYPHTQTQTPTQTPAKTHTPTHTPMPKSKSKSGPGTPHVSRPALAQTSPGAGLGVNLNLALKLGPFQPKPSNQYPHMSPLRGAGVGADMGMGMSLGTDTSPDSCYSESDTYPQSDASLANSNSKANVQMTDKYAREQMRREQERARRKRRERERELERMQEREMQRTKRERDWDSGERPLGPREMR